METEAKHLRRLLSPPLPLYFSQSIRIPFIMFAPFRLEKRQKKLDFFLALHIEWSAPPYLLKILNFQLFRFICFVHLYFAEKMQSRSMNISLYLSSAARLFLFYALCFRASLIFSRLRSTYLHPHSLYFSVGMCILVTFNVRLKCFDRIQHGNW